MTICQAYNTIINKGITPWMAWGIVKWNDGYAIVETNFLKKYWSDKNIFMIRKGECFPKEPIFDR